MDLNCIAIIKGGDVYVGRILADAVKISIPSKTNRDWSNEKEFIDLPLFEESEISNLIDVLIEIREIMKNKEGHQ